jgi:hypothetical protein
MANRNPLPLKKRSVPECIVTNDVCNIENEEPSRKRRFWNVHEDQALIRIATERRAQGWHQIALEIGGNRSAKQCRERWHNHLDPKVNHGMHHFIYLILFKIRLV